jgi:phosphoenolpyruvate synthase/pyruvate phosphate dikinase
MRELLGGKGANLAEMTNLGMPVPQGFTISTEACTKYYDDGEKISEDLEKSIMEYIEKLCEMLGRLPATMRRYMCEEKEEKTCPSWMLAVHGSQR